MGRLAGRWTGLRGRSRQPRQRISVRQAWRDAWEVGNMPNSRASTAGLLQCSTLTSAALPAARRAVRLQRGSAAGEELTQPRAGRWLSMLRLTVRTKKALRKEALAIEEGAAASEQRCCCGSPPAKCCVCVSGVA